MSNLIARDVEARQEPELPRDLRAAAAALREAATARGDCDAGWRLAELAALLDREADLADLEEHDL
jgi:hypothetical protein